MKQKTKCYCGHTITCDCGPKEKPEFVTVNIESATGEDLGKVSYIPLPNVDYTPKQETLEEVALKLYPEEWDWREREIFIEGAKWQQEQDKKK